MNNKHQTCLQVLTIDNKRMIFMFIMQGFSKINSENTWTKDIVYLNIFKIGDENRYN